MTEPALAGRTVLELGSFLAAPFAANILAELGADIIKVEPHSGDPARTMGKGATPSGTFIAYSRGKRSICLNLQTAAGREVLDRLIVKADILVHNLAPDSARRMRVTHDDCYRINPKLVYCHIRGYGPGPLEDKIASNPVAEAATGVMYAHKINGRPTRLGPSYHDQFAGAYAVIGILAALASKDGSKESRRVEVGLYEAGLHVAARELVNRQSAAHYPKPQAEPELGEFSFAGYGAYQSSDDRWIFLVMMTDGHWRKFCEAMELPEGNDAQLATSAQRKEHRKRVETIVSEAVRSMAYDQIAARLSAIDFGYTEVKPAAEVLNDLQAREPGKVVQVVNRERLYTVPNLPIVSPLVRRDMNAAPPELGEQTMSILQSLGYSDDERSRLIAGHAAAVFKPKAEPAA